MLFDITNHIIEDIKRYSKLKQEVTDMLENVWGTVGYDIEDMHFAGINEKIAAFIDDINTSESNYNKQVHEYWLGLDYRDKVVLVKETNLL